jgi:hypothetical protein
MEWLLQLNNEKDDSSSITLTPPMTNLPLEVASASTTQKVLTLLGFYEQSQTCNSTQSL